MENGWEELMLDEDLSNLIATEIKQKFFSTITVEDAELDIELLDLKVIQCVLF